MACILHTISSWRWPYNLHIVFAIHVTIRIAGSCGRALNVKARTISHRVGTFSRLRICRVRVCRETRIWWGRCGAAACGGPRAPPAPFCLPCRRRDLPTRRVNAAAATGQRNDNVTPACVSASRKVQRVTASYKVQHANSVFYISKMAAHLSRWLPPVVRRLFKCLPRYIIRFTILNVVNYVYCNLGS